MIPQLRTALALLSLLLLCVACGSGGGSSVASNSQLDSPNRDTSDELFASNRLLRVDIEMDPDDYEQLRQEGRSAPQVFSGCSEGYEYSHFQSTVTVDGERLGRVDIRKKGFLGSLSTSRPSFKLNFSRYDSSRRLHGLEKMTLNNNRQDPGNTHQCLSYQLFRDAGLVAPRCNFARVSMNGEDLGIYSHIDSIDTHFLRRNYPSDRGNLYEAQGADFGQFTKEYYQAKTNEDFNDRSDLAMVADALDSSDDNLAAVLGQQVDLDEYLSYWAMEVITGHWDSATGNANNYYVYREPNSELFYYIPWGTDGAMDSLNPQGGSPIFRYTEIPSRLYGIEQYRERYHQRLLELLDNYWNEENLNAEVDRIRDLTGTEEEALRQVRAFIDVQAGILRDEVANPGPSNRTIVDRARVCRAQDISPFRASFSNGRGTLEYVDEQGNTITLPTVLLPPEEGGIGALGGGLSSVMVGSLNGNSVITLLLFETPGSGPGEVPLHGVATTAILLRADEAGVPRPYGVAGNGSFFLDAPAVAGQPLSGSLDAQVFLSEQGFQGL